MPKAYWVNFFRTTGSSESLSEYVRLAGPAMTAAGGRFLARGEPAHVFESGVMERMTIIEFESTERAAAAYRSPEYQAALRALGRDAEREIRIIEGVADPSASTASALRERRRFQQVDVFGAKAFTGNPVAVVLDGGGLSTEEMQRFSRWTNLSEATFLLPPTNADADYRVRIFTLARELPFAGHPTLGSCHAWLAAGGKPRRNDLVVQECGVGLIQIRRDSDGLAFAAPPLVRSGPVDKGFVERLAAVVGIDRREIVDAQWVDNGPGWVALLLKDAAAVLALNPDIRRYAGEGSLDVGLVGPYPEGSECDFEVRAIFSDERGGTREDSVTGSLNASLAQWLLATGRARAPYVASQGTRLGVTGRVRVDQDRNGTIWVGGATVTCIDGQVES